MERDNMNIRLQNLLNMAGVCIAVPQGSEYKPVWDGKPPLDFSSNLARIQVGYANVAGKAATRSRPLDLNRINIQETWEVEYWSRKLQCTQDELIGAVEEVGDSPTAVYKYFGR